MKDLIPAIMIIILYLLLICGLSYAVPYIATSAIHDYMQKHEIQLRFEKTDGEEQ